MSRFCFLCELLTGVEPLWTCLCFLVLRPCFLDVALSLGTSLNCWSSACESLCSSWNRFYGILRELTELGERLWFGLGGLLPTSELLVGVI